MWNQTSSGCDDVTVLDWTISAFCNAAASSCASVYWASDACQHATWRDLTDGALLTPKYRVIQNDGLNFVSLYFKIRTSDKYDMAWTANGASAYARQLVAVFQVLCSLYGLTCVGYAQNCLQFFSSSPLIHVVGRSFCLYTDSLFAQIGDSNDKCSSSLEDECWNEDETHAAQQSPTQF